MLIREEKEERKEGALRVVVEREREREIERYQREKLEVGNKP